MSITVYVNNPYPAGCAYKNCRCCEECEKPSIQLLLERSKSRTAVSCCTRENCPCHQRTR